VTGFALSPIWLGLGHTVQAETPAMAAALCSVAVCLRARSRNWKAGWILFAGALFGAALLFKLFVTVFVVPLALLLWLGPANSMQDRWRLDGGWLRGVPRRGALFSAGTLAVLGLPLLFYDVEAMRDQAIGLHLAKHAVFRHDRLENLTRIAASLAEDPGVFVLALLALALLWKGRVRVAAAWGLVGFLAAGWSGVEQTPVFWRHFILLTPPVAILAGVGAALALTTGKRLRTRFAFGIVATGLFLSPHALGLAQHHWSPTAWAKALDFAAPPSARTEQIVRQLQRHTTEADLVLSDDQMAVYLAGRRSPGMLCDTSYARIASGYLRMRTLIDASRDVRVVAIREKGRLSTLRPFPEWMETNFVPAEPDMESPPVWLRVERRRARP
jgi:hypothetical protein